MRTAKTNEKVAPSAGRRCEIKGCSRRRYARGLCWRHHCEGARPFAGLRLTPEAIGQISKRSQAMGVPAEATVARIVEEWAARLVESPPPRSTKRAPRTKR